MTEDEELIDSLLLERNLLEKALKHKDTLLAQIHGLAQRQEYGEICALVVEELDWD